jgi:D-3-phosphoglycerate dehydrogenase / 2-oxoglutarate reductase
MAKPISKCKVLVTPTSFGKNDPGLKQLLEQTVGEVVYNPVGRPLKSGELQLLVRGCDGFIAGLDEIDASVLEAGKQLRVVARYGVGVDQVDLQAATRLGIVVTNTPGANSVAVAELTITLILALARQLCQADRATHLGEWPRFSGIGLRGKTIGLVGFGQIGREVAARLKAFGCNLIAYDPNLAPEKMVRYGVEAVTLEALLPLADFVSLHAPSLPATQQMVNAQFLSSMKPGSFLVNTARGELVDENALFDALQSGRLRGAALDCFRKEPPEPDHPLLQLSQVILTPHSGSHTDEAVFQMGQMALKDCLAVLSGGHPEHVVNPKVYHSNQQESDVRAQN